MSAIMDRLRAILGREPRQERTAGREELDEDCAVDAVEADRVASRDDAFTRMTEVPSSLDDKRR